VVTVLEMQEDTFLQKNFEYYQEWHHWLGKADKLKRAALILYQAGLPDLRLYDAAYKTALAEIGEEGRAPVRHPDGGDGGSVKVTRMAWCSDLMLQEPPSKRAHRRTPGWRPVPRLRTNSAIIVSAGTADPASWRKDYQTRVESSAGILRANYRKFTDRYR
jgi:hypothetical protein